MRLVIKVKGVPLQHKTKSSMAYLNRVFDVRLKAHLKEGTHVEEFDIPGCSCEPVEEKKNLT